MKLEDAEAPIRAALERLAESPIEHLCFVIIEEREVTGRFVQFCTPPPPSRFKGSPRARWWRYHNTPISERKPLPLIYDGTGLSGKCAYEPVQEQCDVDGAVAFALDTLSKYLPPEAELHITADSTRTEQPS